MIKIKAAEVSMHTLHDFTPEGCVSPGGSEKRNGRRILGYPDGTFRTKSHHGGSAWAALPVVGVACCPHTRDVSPLPLVPTEPTTLGGVGLPDEANCGAARIATHKTRLYLNFQSQRTQLSEKMGWPWGSRSPQPSTDTTEPEESPPARGETSAGPGPG